MANAQRAVENRKRWRELVAKVVVSGAPTNRKGYGKVKSSE